MARYIGIDLGTTNSTVSVSNLTLRGDIEATTLRVTQIGEDGLNIIEEESLPSVLYVEEGGTNYVGHYAKRMNSVYTDRVIKESKRFIGEDRKWVIDGEDYYPDKVASFFLDMLKKQVEKYYNDEKVDGAVITIPANFHFQHQQATRNAGVLAGFEKDKIHMIPEPTAALLDFLNEEGKLDVTARRINLTNGAKNLMVFDLGGGTCDVSILSVEEDAQGGIDIQELSISQYMELGGRDFDQEITKMLFLKYLAATNTTQKSLLAQYGKPTLINLVECFVDIAERAKKRFSSQVFTSRKDYFAHAAEFDTLVYREQLPAALLPQELVQTISITKAEYDAAIKTLLYKEFSKDGLDIESPILNALEEARLGAMSLDEIDAVFLVGGMTYYPTIQLRIHEIFNKRIKPLQSLNPMLSVSRGAAIYHQQLGAIRYNSVDELEKAPVVTTKGTVIANTVPSNVFIDVAGGDPIALLEKGQSLPYEKTFKDQFYVSGIDNGISEITTMRLALFTAPNAKSIRTKKLKEARIEFKKPIKKNSKLVLKVTCDEERDVKLRAWLDDDPTEMLEVHIGAKEYSEEEINRLKELHSKVNVVGTLT